MSLRFSLAPVLMERSEKGRLIMTAKMLQERYDRHLSDPCLPHLFTVLLGMLPTEANQGPKAELGEKAEAEKAPTSWHCTLNNIGIVEKRLKTQHGKLTIESMCIGLRFSNFM